MPRKKKVIKISKKDRDKIRKTISNAMTFEEAYATLEEAFLIKNKDYERMPASFSVFVKSKYFLNLDGDIYENVIKIGTRIVEQNKREVILLAGIGGGKSTLSQLLACYYCHQLLCLKDPHAFYNLTKDKPIAIMNMGLTASQAKNVIFTGIRSFISNSSFFKSYESKILLTSISFIKGIEILSGNSKETAPIGLNIFIGILDEAAFYLDNNKKSVAGDIFNSMSKRITSRFQNSGKLIAVSSPRYIDDFIDKAYRDSIKHNTHIFGYKASTWHMKDRRVMDNDVFVFDVQNLIIRNDIKVSDYMRKHLKFDTKKYDDEENKKFWIIPESFRLDFVRSPERSMRDFGAEPSETLEAFIKMRDYIDEALGTTENRVSDIGIWNIQKPVPEQVYIHIDLALNKGGKGDAAGISVARCVGFNTKQENRPIIEILFCERITAGVGSEINFSDVRQRVISMHDNGWRIGGVTLDGWNSLDFMQILKARGIVAGYQSVDTTLEPYNALKEALYERRLLLPDMDIIRKELRELELIEGKKVDHPDTGSKDVADSIAGSIYAVINNIGSGANIKYKPIRF